VSTAWLGIGSNVNPVRNVRIAVKALSERFPGLLLSPVYRSQAVGFDGDDFINAVAQVSTTLSPFELRDWLRDLEDQHGRQRDVPKFSDRVLDVDILMYDQQVMDAEGLVLPRPEILHFAHVLRPLAELAPELTYPGQAQTLGQLWAVSKLRKTPLEALATERFTAAAG
jgi:2-amino-4-hydroxy-6-hydroxymethyldihydropteridine diphosphokinase